MTPEELRDLVFDAAYTTMLGAGLADVYRPDDKSGPVLRLARAIADATVAARPTDAEMTPVEAKR